MRPSTVAEVAARVAAWHNRHPLARRITAAQVQGVGVVAMPFVLPAPMSAPPAQRISEPALFAADGPADSGAAQVPAAPAPSLRERALAAAASADDPASPSPAAPAPLPSSKTVGQRLQDWLRGLRPAARRGFSEDFLEPLSPGRIARFALRHGSPQTPPPAAGPLRVVLEDDGLCARGTVQTLHLRTAAIEWGSRRVRVLLGEGPDAAVIGPRLWSPARMAGSAVAWALAMAGLIAAQTMSRQAPAADEALAAFGASAASAPAGAAPLPAADARGFDAASAPSATPSANPATSGPAATDTRGVTRAASAVVLPAADGEARPSPSEARPLASVVAAASASAPAGSQAGPAVTPALPPTQAASTPMVVAVERPASPSVPWPPNIRPVIDVETARAAKRDSAALRAQGGALPALASSDAPGAVAGGRKATSNAAPSPGGEGVTYALAARSTRSRAASELLLGLMKTAAAAGGDKAQQRTEILPAQQGWRAIWWPFHSRQDAERAQALLVNVGLEAELLEF